MKQMDRRLLILMRLREERAVRAQDLAEECECAVRTIYRDIEALCQAGVPVAAMAGEGYRLVPGYHLQPISFTVEEAVQLLLGVDLASNVSTAEQRESARAAAAKVSAVLRPETREEVDRLRERIRVSHWMHRNTSPWLAVLQQGVTQDRVLWLRYHSFGSDEVTERKVEPYTLVFYSGDWHLVGYCRLRESVRDFRADRIRDAEVLEERFQRPVGFSSEDDGRPGAGQEIRVWLESSVVPWAREAPPFGFQREEQSEGGSVFTIEFWELRRLMPWLLGWGSSARVLSPPDVIDRMRREAEALVEAYPEG
jgi:predicted DNA-binding transcriptional regulator YafY